jgi:hypothetical protein
MPELTMRQLNARLEDLEDALTELRAARTADEKATAKGKVADAEDALEGAPVPSRAGALSAREARELKDLLAERRALLAEADALPDDEEEPEDEPDDERDGKPAAKRKAKPKDETPDDDEPDEEPEPDTEPVAQHWSERVIG